MALRELNQKVLVQRMQWGAVLRRVAKAAASRSRFSEQEIRRSLIQSLQKYETTGEKLHRINQIDKELQGYINHNRQVKLADSGGRKHFVVDKSLESKYKKEQPGKYKKQLPDVQRKQAYKSNGPEADVADLHKKETTNSKNGQTNENPLKKEAETAQKEAANTKETKTTSSKQAEKPTEKPKTNTETQNESTSNNSQNTSSNTTQNDAAIPQWKAGETEGVHGKEYIDGKKVKKFHKEKGLVSLEEFDKLEGKSSASPQQQGLGTRLRNWLIGPAAPVGSEVAWNPQGLIRRYADLRPYVEGRPFLYNPWVSSTALWTLAGGNEGHKRGYSYPDSYQVGFQSSPLMRILGIASGLTGVGDTFEEMERNGVIQKVNRNGNRQMVAAPQNYLDWDSLTDMDMAYNPYGGYMDNISPDFLED